MENSFDIHSQNYIFAANFYAENSQFFPGGKQNKTEVLEPINR